MRQRRKLLSISAGFKLKPDILSNLSNLLKIVYGVKPYLQHPFSRSRPIFTFCPPPKRWISAAAIPTALLVVIKYHLVNLTSLQKLLDMLWKPA